jgi:hypothetical protein
MKKLLLASVLFFSLTGFSQIYQAKDNSTLIHFYSKTPLEDIDAANKGAIIVLNTTTGNLQVSVTIQNFKFKNGLMEEHFNENYLETQKQAADGSFPNRNAVFKGKINEKVDYTKDGENKVTVTGTLKLHGVTKDVTMDGTLTKKGNEILLDSKFKIKIADYNIKVPSAVVTNIAEVVDVTLVSTLEPHVKK